MKKLSKAIIILYLLTLSNACERYFVGDIHVTQSNFPHTKGEFGYTTHNGRIILQGKIDDEFFSGDVYPQPTVEKVEINRYPGIDKRTIKQKNIFAFTRLTGNKGNTVECFIKQNLKHKFTAGGVGRCYQQNGRTFDILLEPAS